MSRSGCIYILTGILPIEAQIHLKALVFFNNVCHQDESDILLVMRVTALLFVFDTFLIVLMVSTMVLIIPCHIVGLVKHKFYIYAEVILGQGHWYPVN
jgi:hypothetical protein